MNMKKKLKVKKISMDVFPVDYTFIYGEEVDVKRYVYKKFEGVLNSDFDLIKGCCFHTDNSIVIILTDQKGWTGNVGFESVLVHECIHASWHLQDITGEIFNTDAEETQAYIVQKIFSDGLKFYKPFFKSKR